MKKSRIQKFAKKTFNNFAGSTCSLVLTGILKNKQVPVQAKKLARLLNGNMRVYEWYMNHSPTKSPQHST